MNRRKSREQAFIFLFESTFGFQKAQEIIENAGVAREESLSDFAKKLFEGALENQHQIDECIEKNIDGWNIERLSKLTLSVLRLAVFELMFEKDTPSSVAINEAIVISKKYGSKEEAAYINGVLGSVSRNI